MNKNFDDIEPLPAKTYNQRSFKSLNEAIAEALSKPAVPILIVEPDNNDNK